MLLAELPEPLRPINVLAVEVHQIQPLSSDLFFDLELVHVPNLDTWWASAKGGEAGLREFLAQWDLPTPEDLRALDLEPLTPSQIELPPFPFTLDHEK
jgi:hypothetical protein